MKKTLEDKWLILYVHVRRAYNRRIEKVTDWRPQKEGSEEDPKIVVK